MSTAGGHRTGFTRFPAEPRGMPEDHFARAAHPCRGQFPRSAAGEQLRGSSRTRQGVACDHAEPRIHCRSTRRQEWPTPIRLADRPPSQTCAMSGMEPADIARSGATGRLICQRLQGTTMRNRDNCIHVGRTGCITQPCDPAKSRGACMRSMSRTPGNQTQAEPIRSGSWAKPSLNCADLKVHGQFTDRTRPEHLERQHSH